MPQEVSKTKLLLEFGMHQVKRIATSFPEAESLRAQLMACPTAWQEIVEFQTKIENDPQYGDNVSKQAHVRHLANAQLVQRRQDIERGVKAVHERIQKDRKALMERIEPRSELEQARMVEIRQVLRTLKPDQLARTIAGNGNDEMLQRTVATSAPYMLDISTTTRGEALTRSATLAGPATVDQLYNVRTGSMMLEQADEVFGNLNRRIQSLPDPKAKAQQRQEQPKQTLYDAYEKR